MSRDPYDILGASPIDPPETIKAKYRNCILEHHPDRPSGNVEMYKLVVWAYKSITDPGSTGKPDMPRKSGHIKKQSAQYTRKDPAKKGKAARRTARRTARTRRHKSRASSQVRCGSCDGTGYLERTTGVLFRKTRRHACDTCGGTGKVDDPAGGC